MKQFRITLIAAILLLALGLYVFMTERQDAGDKGGGEPLFSLLKNEDISSLTFKYPGAAVYLRKVEDKWLVGQGGDDNKEFDADAISVSSILYNITSLRFDKAIADKVMAEDAESLSKYGLINAKAEVGFQVGNETKSFLIGNETPTGAGAYVFLSDENKVVLVDTASVMFFLDKTVNDLRDKNILKLNAEDITKLRVFGKDHFLEIIEDKDGFWVPENYDPGFDLSQDQILGLLYTLSDLNISRFIDDDPADLDEYGLHPADMTVEIYVGDKRAALLFGIEEENQRYLMIDGQPSVYSVMRFIYKHVPRSINDLRERNLLGVDPAVMTGIELHGIAEEPIIYERKGLKWKRSDDQKQRDDGFEIKNILAAVQGLRIDGFIDDDPPTLEPYGLDDPRAIVVIHDSKQTIELIIGDEKGSITYVKLSDQSPVYTVSSTALSALLGTDEEAEEPAISESP